MVQDTRPFVQHNQTAHTLLISGKQTCVIATKKAGSVRIATHDLQPLERFKLRSSAVLCFSSLCYRPLPMHV